MSFGNNKAIKGFLIFACFYFLFESVLFLSNIRLLDASLYWSDSAKAYAGLINRVLGSFELAIAILCYKMQSDLQKYKELIKISGFWSFFHGLVLFILNLGNNYVDVFAKSPSLYVWFPFYNEYVFFEAGLLVFYSLVVFSWSRKNG